jgi:hypothetical protein
VIEGVTMCVRQDLKMKTRLIHLRWDGQAINSKIHGTLGTLGILARFLGEFERFSTVPKDANGTLDEGRSKESCRLSVVRSTHEERNVKRPGTPGTPPENPRFSPAFLQEGGVPPGTARTPTWHFTTCLQMRR